MTAASMTLPLDQRIFRLRAVRIFKTHREQAIANVRENLHPEDRYLWDRLRDCTELGIPRDSIERASAGIDHVPLEAASDGHCALRLQKLKVVVTKLLRFRKRQLSPPGSQEGNPRAIPMTAKKLFEVLLNFPEPRRTLTATALRPSELLALTGGTWKSRSS